MRVEVYPSFCKVLGAPPNVLKDLKDFLTIDVPGARFTKLYRQHIWDGKQSFFFRPANKFPIGFLRRVQENFFIPEEDIIDKRKVIDYKFVIPKLNNIELRDYQKESILTCLEYKNCLVESATNSGKSAVISALCKIFQDFKVLIIVQRIELLRQLRTMIENLTDLNTGYIAAFDSELNKNIVVSMIQTLHNRVGKSKPETDFFRDADVLIVDETHHVRSKTHQRLLATSNAVIRYGFSGTIPEEDTYDGWLCRMYIGDVVIKVDNQQLIERGISAKPIVKMLEVDASFVNGLVPVMPEGLSLEERRDFVKKNYQLMMYHGIVKSPQRNNKIIELIQTECKDRSTLIIVDIIEHGDELVALGKRAGLDIKFVQGNSTDREELIKGFTEGKVKTLVATTIVDEGLDIDCISALVLASGKKSRRQILQRIGRGLRKKKQGENVVYVYDFADVGNRYLSRHSKIRHKLFLEEGFEVNLIKLGEGYKCPEEYTKERKNI